MESALFRLVPRSRGVATYSATRTNKDGELCKGVHFDRTSWLDKSAGCNAAQMPPRGLVPSVETLLTVGRRKRTSYAALLCGCSFPIH